MDYTLLMAVVILMLFGILMVYSASPVLAYEEHGDSAFYFKRQLIWAIAALAAGFYFFRRSPVEMKKFIMPGLILSIVLIFAVHIPHLGRRVGGATRWLNLGPFSFQPFEMAKLFYVMYLAELFSNEQNPFSRKMVRSATVTGLICLGLIFQKDLGGTVIILMLYMSLLLIAGVNLWIFAGLIAMALLAVVVLIKAEPYRMKRIMMYLNPWSDYYGAGWQIIQSMIAVGSGGIFGVGFTQSQQKYLYLPTPHTDYIFSIIGEEWGLIGSVAVIGGFFVVLSRGLFISINVPDRFMKFMAAGLTLTIISQVCINIPVALGLMPSKGTTLPFLSYGGSSLLFAAIAIGMLLSVSKFAYGNGK
jgi:cell division protein FtsW